MRIIVSEEFSKLSKSKYPKSETEPTNPWAVCTDRVGRDDEDKYERCVHHIKDQNRKENKSKKSSDLGDMKPSEIGGIYGPAVEEEDDRAGFHVKQKGRAHRPGLRPGAGGDATWDDVIRKIRQNKELEPQFASNKKVVIEAKKKEK
jgi:hypothetical protein